MTGSILRALRMPRLDRRPGLLIAMGVVVSANYLAQVVYTAHLYGPFFSLIGGLLLAATLIWFGAGLVLAARGRRVGFLALLSYFLAVFSLYFRNEILLIPSGYGLPDHLLHESDRVLWSVFLVGDVNFVAAGVFATWLLCLWASHWLPRPRPGGLARPGTQRHPAK